MADVFDQAQELDALNVAEAWKAQQARAAATPKLEAIGECRSPLCGEPLDGGRLFCNSTCASDHHRYAR